MRHEILTLHAYMNVDSPDLSDASASGGETIKRNYKQSGTNTQIFDMARGIFERAREQKEAETHGSFAWNDNAILLR